MKVKSCSHKTHHAPKDRRLTVALDHLKEKDVRLTAPRRAILEILAKTLVPLSSEEIFSRLKKVDLVTVYRSLTTLEEIGLLRRHDFGDTVKRYELSEEGHHHHFIRCRSCGNVEAFEGCEFESAISKTLERKGYRMIHHTLDVQALCADCA